MNLPNLSIEELSEAINTLSQKSLLLILRQGNGYLYKAKSDSEAERLAGMDNDERLIYQHIEAGDNEGVWLKRLRTKVGLPNVVVTRCIKKLEQKMLIKPVSSVKNPTMKIYMLYHLTPSEELTGGAWYTDQELDVDFINTLASQCYKYILSRSFPSAKPGAVYGPTYTFYPTAAQVRRFIIEMAISTVDLSVNDVQTLLNILVYDGKIEKRLAAAESMGMDMDSDGDDDGRSALVDVPCGNCPVFNQCCIDGVVSPVGCVYFKNWLDF
ncbi:RNA polymerase III subunit Rpc34 [Dimargaris cristalligena]|uniref:DNA-directed RNA polymerase III subunit RPC6 n=1 Tax=Dimargaris cristalligena TaxID=215637 RepID=A0A4Q0A3G0_9FUNG|nr:RNA polymerase III subunit Rpc34 [Dimargaris cristalligena]|eukprot:RKP39952.1 RNA polymerase III subunit Rpc34 [Dimargaris cristalligena]